MLPWLCALPSIPLSFSLAAVLPRRLASRVSLRASTRWHFPSEHSLQLGLQGSLIPFAPLAFVPQRQCCPRYLPSPLVFLSISTHFTATPTVPVPPSRLIPRPSFTRSQGWALVFQAKCDEAPTNSLRPVNPDNACIPRITAAAGTWLADAYSTGTVPCIKRCRASLSKEVYDPKAFIPHAESLRQAFAHCAIFPVAAIRRCIARVSVLLWLTDLSVQLPVIALVGFYPTN